MFYRPGGSSSRINTQYDTVYSDQVGGATGWLPISQGDNIAVNICRAAINFQSAAKSQILPSPIAPECDVLLEMTVYGGDKNSEAVPIDRWQNMVVATSRKATRQGWVRLRTLSLNNLDGTGLRLDLLISRTGDGQAG